MYVINLNIGSWNRSFYIVCIKMFFFLINCVLKIWNNGKLGGGGVFGWWRVGIGLWGSLYWKLGKVGWVWIYKVIRRL